MNSPEFTKAVPLTGPDDERHGRDSCYTYWGCRCDRCRAAHAAAARARRKTTPPQVCPVCDGFPVKPPIMEVADGKNCAWYLCANNHLWELRWPVTVPAAAGVAVQDSAA